MTNKPQIIRCTAILEKGGITAAIGIYSCTDHLHAVVTSSPAPGPAHHKRRNFVLTLSKDFNRDFPPFSPDSGHYRVCLSLNIASPVKADRGRSGVTVWWRAEFYFANRHPKHGHRVAT